MRKRIPLKKHYVLSNVTLNKLAGVAQIRFDIKEHQPLHKYK